MSFRSSLLVRNVRDNTPVRVQVTQLPLADPAGKEKVDSPRSGDLGQVIHPFEWVTGRSGISTQEQTRSVRSVKLRVRW